MIRKSERVYPQVFCAGFAGAGGRREKPGCGSAQSGAPKVWLRKNAQVILMPGAREVLAWADQAGDSAVCLYS